MSNKVNKSLDDVFQVNSDYADNDEDIKFDVSALVDRINQSNHTTNPPSLIDKNNDKPKNQIVADNTNKVEREVGSKCVVLTSKPIELHNEVILSNANDDAKRKTEIATIENNEFKVDINKVVSKVAVNYQQLLDKSEEVLDTAIQAVNMTGSPKAIESASKVIDQLANINDKLVDLILKKQRVYAQTRRDDIDLDKITEIVANKGNVNIQNNNISFVGEPNKLIDMLKNIDKQHLQTPDYQMYGEKYNPDDLQSASSATIVDINAVEEDEK